MDPRFAHIRHWVFDLDNTLYPASCDLFALIDARMTAFIVRQFGMDAVAAHMLQKRYFYEYGTTLAGLMQHDGIDPHDFLNDVHGIAFDRLSAAPQLAADIAALPGEKHIFTNGDVGYARNVLAARGLDGVFDQIVDIHACAYRPKPEMAAYQTLIERTGINPALSLFADDMARNLAPAKALGMATIWVNNGSDWGSSGADAGHIDQEITDLEHWLDTILRGSNTP